MDIKKTLQDTAKTAKFEGLSVHVASTPESRLAVSVEAKGSIDLPGDLDAGVAQVLNLLGLGNYKLPSPSPEPSPKA